MKSSTKFSHIVSKVSHDQIAIYSAQASFFIILSLIPFFMLLMSALRFVMPDSVKDDLPRFMSLLPSGLLPYVKEIFYELLTGPSVSAISLTALMALWSSSKGILSIENALHQIYDIPIISNYLFRRFRAILYTMLFMLVILFTFILLVLGPMLQEFLVSHLQFFSYIMQVFLAFRVLISAAAFIALFLGIYKVLSGCHFAVWKNLPGVIFSTVGWLIFSFGYSVYVSNFTSYTYLYGTLGIFILMMLWIYFCIMILLIGGEINIILHRWNEY